MPLALKYLVKLANRILASQDNKKELLEQAKVTLIRYSEILGMNLESTIGVKNKQILDMIINIRTELRRRKIYDPADVIRNELASIGVMVEDKNNESYYYTL